MAATRLFMSTVLSPESEERSHLIGQLNVNTYEDGILRNYHSAVELVAILILFLGDLVLFSTVQSYGTFVGCENYDVGI